MEEDGRCRGGDVIRDIFMIAHTHTHTHTHTPGSSQTLSNKAKSATLPASSFAYDEGLPCLEKAKQRKEPIAVAYDSKVITDHAVSTRVPWMTWSWLLGYT